VSGPQRLRWDDDEEDTAAAERAAAERRTLLDHQRGEAIVLGNEFADVRVCRVETRNGSRLLIESPRSGQWVALCPLEVEALTRQNTATFSAMIGKPFGPLVEPAEEAP
jgi:hypothetical protein